MLIHVTQEHIDRASQHIDRCPVALAIIEVYPIEKIAVGTSSLFFGKRIIKLPSNVVDRIFNYDLTKTMEPFSFELEIVCSSK